MSDTAADDASPASPMVSVVVLVYRSAGTLAQLVSRIRGVMTTANWPWEIILVDDSTPDDETRFELQQLGSSPDIRIVSLRRNRGAVEGDRTSVHRSMS